MTRYPCTSRHKKRWHAFRLGHQKEKRIDAVRNLKWQPWKSLATFIFQESSNMHILYNIHPAFLHFRFCSAMEKYQRGEGKKLHDPLAMAAVVDEAVCSFREVHVFNDRQGWGSVLQAGTNTWISIDYNDERFRQILVGSGPTWKLHATSVQTRSSAKRISCMETYGKVWVQSAHKSPVQTWERMKNDERRWIAVPLWWRNGCCRVFHGYQALQTAGRGGGDAWRFWRGFLFAMLLAFAVTGCNALVSATPCCYVLCILICYT